MDRRAIFLLLAAVQVFYLLSQGEAQFGAPYFEHGMGHGNISCNDLVCGRGRCNSSYSSSDNGTSFSYSYNYSYSSNESLCNCKPGWRRPYGKFMYSSCVIPNCTIKNCDYELPKIPEEQPRNTSDPCSWAYCGKGKCVATSDYSHRCECEQGFVNLFNNTAFPCYNQCMISDDQCKEVGATLSNATTESPGGSGEGNSGSYGAVISPSVLLGLPLLILSIATLV